MKKPLAVSIRTLLAVLGTSAAAQAQTSIFYQAPTGTGGTWNLYEYVLGGVNFKDANIAATALPNPVGGPVLGYLAEIGSAFENMAVNQMTYRGDAWIGLTDRAGAASAEFPSMDHGFVGEGRMVEAGWPSNKAHSCPRFFPGYSTPGVRSRFRHRARDMGRRAT